MGKQVAQYVHVSDPNSGSAIVLKPGDEVPDGVEVGDHVFESETVEDVPTPAATPASVPEPPAAEDEVQDDLTGMSHAELDEVGDSLGIELSGNRADKQAAIRAARA